ncbi:sNPF family protein [Megaselia abdita]
MALRIVLFIAAVANLYSVCNSYSYSENTGQEEAMDSFLSSKDESDIYNRKALRSPSLRLRFGRTDPYIHINSEGLENTKEKRSPWIGEVNQKPIRSPSLRLRFGRRSDPTIDIISKLNSILNNKYEKQESRKMFGNNSNEIYPQEKKPLQILTTTFNKRELLRKY